MADTLWWNREEPPDSVVEYVFKNTHVVPGNVEDNYLVLGDITFINNFNPLDSLAGLEAAGSDEVNKIDSLNLNWLNLVVDAYSYPKTLKTPPYPDYKTWQNHQQLDNRITLADTIQSLLLNRPKKWAQGVTDAMKSLDSMITMPSKQYPTCMTCHQNRS